MLWRCLLLLLLSLLLRALLRALLLLMLLVCALVQLRLLLLLLLLPCIGRRGLCLLLLPLPSLLRLGLHCLRLRLRLGLHCLRLRLRLGLGLRLQLPSLLLPLSHQVLQRPLRLLRPVWPGQLRLLLLHRLWQQLLGGPLAGLCRLARQWHLTQAPSRQLAADAGLPRRPACRRDVAVCCRLGRVPAATQRPLAVPSAVVRCALVQAAAGTGPLRRHSRDGR